MREWGPSWPCLGLRAEREVRLSSAETQLAMGGNNPKCYSEDGNDEKGTRCVSL
jgi:hypothetical protein